MQIFLDTVDLKTIEDYTKTGLIDGVTTNPSLAAKAKLDYPSLIKAIVPFVSETVSAQVVATDYENMLKEGEKLAEISPKVAIKLPLTMDGLRACRYFSNQQVAVNITLCFNEAQALLAAKAGASYISVFMGRLDDNQIDSKLITGNIAKILENYQFPSKLLAASIRHASHFLDAALIGADVITIPPILFPQLVADKLTNQGLEKFLNDWKNRGK